MKLSISEILLLRSALNSFWYEYTKKNCPKEEPMNLNKYHAWCRIQEKDKMTDLYWIQSVRKKLNIEERELLK